MRGVTMLSCLLISFLSSVTGAICGIGGGVIIKPVLDLFRVADVSTISFLSGCTVLSMSGYSVVKSFVSGEQNISIKTGTPLAAGAVVGGILGKQLFSVLKSCFANEATIGVIQSICLAVVTILTLAYTLNKRKITPKHANSSLISVGIGIILGVMSSFLGIGGGPINLVALQFFFGMDIKTAAANSLYIILFSQVASLLTSVLTANVPPIEVGVMLFMIIGGIGGGILGRSLNKRMSVKAVDRLFILLMIIIILISIYNTYTMWNG